MYLLTQAEGQSILKDAGQPCSIHTITIALSANRLLYTVFVYVPCNVLTSILGMGASYAGQAVHPSM